MKTGGWFSIGEGSVVHCRTCGGPVYWRESKRTGRRYPAQLQRVNSDWPSYWVTHAPHSCPPPAPSDHTRQVQVVRTILGNRLLTEVQRPIVREAMVEAFGEAVVAEAEK